MIFHLELALGEITDQMYYQESAERVVLGQVGLRQFSLLLVIRGRAGARSEIEI